jgi:hypothetical protein
MVQEPYVWPVEIAKVELGIQGDEQVSVSNDQGSGHKDAV